MISLLLDTHTFLWFVWDSPLLSPSARALIEESENRINVSIVSAWETAIKVSTGKLMLTQSVERFFEEQAARNRFNLLPIELRHAARSPHFPSIIETRSTACSSPRV